SEVINEKIQGINQLFIEGFYFEALDSLVDFEQTENLTSEDQFWCKLLKSKVCFELGEYTEALKFAEEACSKSEELENQSYLVDGLISKAWALLELKNLDLVQQIISEGEDLLNDLTLVPKSEFARKKALLKLVNGLLFLYKEFNLDKAIEYAEAGLRLSEEHDHKKEVALALQHTSMYYAIAGNLDRALDYLERCLKVQRTYRKRDDWMTLKELGALNGAIGELKHALDYTKQSCDLAEEMGNNVYIAQCLNNSALIYRQMGEAELAMEALEQSLLIWEKEGNKKRLMGGLDSLFKVSLDLNSLKQAQQYLLRMEKINERLEDKRSALACRVNKALLLKMSKDSLEKIKAKEILQEVVKEEIIDWEFTERALLHLCDILLFEFQTFKDQEVLPEIDLLINKLLDFGETQSNYNLLAETYLLQGKLASIKLNIGDARQLFTKSERIAENHGLHLLARSISSEHDKLLEQLEILFRAPVSERLNVLEIDKTLDHMMGKKMMEPPELIDEDPILLIIMDKDGNACFNYNFREDFEHSDLFSSFISAFNTFSSEVFSKTIDRIKIGDNSIFMKLVEPFVTCYVSKGQSYPALNKLNKFSDSIKKESEIWEKLIKAIKSSQEINLDKLPSLGSIVDQIFAH
ncbi:MAG: tetratricopeptide repeat protein, partial [Candidatus Heimdallarchaeota archaeon]